MRDISDESCLRRDVEEHRVVRGGKPRDGRTEKSLINKLACLKAELAAVVARRSMVIDSLEATLALYR